MRIVCPACSAAYEVPDALIGRAPRRLRCARCGEEWAIDAPPPSEPEYLPAAAEEAPDHPISPAAEVPAPLSLRVPELRIPDSPYEGMRRTEEARAGGGVALAWVLSLVVLAGLAGGAFVWRDQVMAAWPPSQRLYAALGFASP